MRSFSIVSTLSLIVLVGCSTERAAPQPAPPPLATEPVTLAPQAPPAAPAAPAAAHLVSALAETEGRDPFEPASLTPAAPSRNADVRLRKSKQFGIDELKLVGIVSNAESPRAMLIDPRGKGWLVTRGELLGRPEVLHDRDGDHAVSWRVDRIRDSEVVLIREDAAHSTLVPSATRVLALHHAQQVGDDAVLDETAAN